MTESAASTDARTGELVEPSQWLSAAEVAEQLGVSPNHVRHMIRDRVLLAVHRNGALQVPVELVSTAMVRKHLPGVLTLLLDAGYNEEESLRWLYTFDDSLPGCPAVALSGDKATEVKRRAQALGF